MKKKTLINPKLTADQFKNDLAVKLGKSVADIESLIAPTGGTPSGKAPATTALTSNPDPTNIEFHASKYLTDKNLSKNRYHQR